MHAVLHAQHLDGRALLLQALEQRALHLHLLGQLRQDGGWQLLGVSHQHHPARVQVTVHVRTSHSNKAVLIRTAQTNHEYNNHSLHVRISLQTPEL